MNDKCPTHDQPWRVIPAGVSKKTGRAYPAFKVCPVDKCKERPVELDLSDPIDDAISQGPQAPQTAQGTVDERSYRIERQHSQEQAIRFLELYYKMAPSESFPTEEELLKQVKALTTHFHKDLDR